MPITSGQNVPDEVLINIIRSCIDQFDLTVLPETNTLNQSIQIIGWPDLTSPELAPISRALPTMKADLIARARVLEKFSGRLIIKAGIHQPLITNALQVNGELYDVRSLIRVVEVEHEVSVSSGFLQLSRLNWTLLPTIARIVCVGTGDLKPSTEPSPLQDVEGCILDLPSQTHRGANMVAQDLLSEMQYIRIIPKQSYLNQKGIKLVIHTYQRDKDYWPGYVIWTHRVVVDEDRLSFEQVSRVQDAEVSSPDQVRVEIGVTGLQARARFADMLALSPIQETPSIPGILKRKFSDSDL